MTWFDSLKSIEAFDACVFDAALVDALEARSRTRQPRPLRFATPSFQSYASSELSQCCNAAFPVFSVTGGACALQCEHCRARILEPMIPAENPEKLEAKVRAMMATRQVRGFLLSGGSNRRNEIAYERYLPAVARLKRDYPALNVAAHTGLIDLPRAHAMAEAGIDVAMIDIIGADETIRDVYHLDRPVADFEASLSALAKTSMRVVPHIVIGLHFGNLLGEYRALDICASYPIEALVLVVVMPVHARPGQYREPPINEVVEFMETARRRLSDRQVTLGCARPFGLYRRTLDAYAVMAGLDSIAFPSEGSVALARSIGRPLDQTHGCCAMKIAPQRLIEATQ